MLDRVLQQHIQTGQLRVTYPDGQIRAYGNSGPVVEWRLRSPAAARRILRDPEYEIGETYVDGLWDTNDLAQLIELLFRNFRGHPGRRPAWWQRLMKSLRQLNRVVSARRHIAHHYDLDEWLFRRFLDREMHYSCAYFADPSTPLEDAQSAKCAHLAAKLLLEPGQEVLDIGCGWGGLALYLAEQHGVQVTGITLSREQWRVANERARSRGLGRQVRFLYEDYREHQGHYDRIVSVGMFEHVGTPNYGRFFQRISEMLRPDGVAVLHHIGRPGPPGDTNSWIRRFIFPGGYNPALSEVAASLEQSGLWTTDIEIWRLHYRYTLREWLRRFTAARAQVVEHKGERFARLWEFYLAACEAAFATGELVVFQFQFSNALTAVPLTRNYLYHEPQARHQGRAGVGANRA